MQAGLRAAVIAIAAAGLLGGCASASKPGQLGDDDAAATAKLPPVPYEVTFPGDLPADLATLLPQVSKSATTTETPPTSRLGIRQRAEELRDPVLHHLVDAHAAGDIGAEGHGRVHMAAGDRADAVGHGNDRKAEGERDPELADVSGTSEHSGAASEQDQGCSSEKFGEQLLQHPSLPRAADTSANGAMLTQNRLQRQPQKGLATTTSMFYFCSRPRVRVILE